MEDQDLTKYYEAVLDTLTTHGWTYIVQDFEEFIKSHDSLANCSSSEEFWLNKGRVEMAKRIVELRSAYEQAYEENNNA